MVGRARSRRSHGKIGDCEQSTFIITLDTKLREFHYKILHRICYTDVMLFKFGLAETPLCYFCNEELETYLIIRSKLSKSPFSTSLLFAKCRKKHTKSNVSLRIKTTNSTSTIKNGNLDLSCRWWNFRLSPRFTTTSTNVAFSYLFLQVGLA